MYCFNAIFDKEQCVLSFILGMREFFCFDNYFIHYIIFLFACLLFWFLVVFFRISVFESKFGGMHRAIPPQ
jgi:hypothetical protein